MEYRRPLNSYRGPSSRKASPPRHPPPPPVNRRVLAHTEQDLVDTHIHLQYADHRAVRRALQKEPLKPKAQENYTAFEHIARIGNTTNVSTLGWSERLREGGESVHQVGWNQSTRPGVVADPLRVEQRKEVMAMIESGYQQGTSLFANGSTKHKSPLHYRPRRTTVTTTTSKNAKYADPVGTPREGYSRREEGDICLRLAETRRRLEARIQASLGLSSPTHQSNRQRLYY